MRFMQVSSDVMRKGEDIVEIWKHYQEYNEARDKVLTQSLEEDLKVLDDLFGRDNLRYGASEEEVKREALRQIEIEFRSERNDLAEAMVMVGMHNKSPNLT
jgi:hypothetical protein